MSTLVIKTGLGDLRFTLLPSMAPETVAHIVKLVEAKLFDGVAKWYRCGPRGGGGWVGGGVHKLDRD